MSARTWPVVRAAAGQAIRLVFSWLAWLAATITAGALLSVSMQLFGWWAPLLVTITVVGPSLWWWSGVLLDASAELVRELVDRVRGSGSS